MKNFEIDFVKYFDETEKEAVVNYIYENFDDLDLHDGFNNVDVSKAIHRTANVDVYCK